MKSEVREISNKYLYSAESITKTGLLMQKLCELLAHVGSDSLKEICRTSWNDYQYLLNDFTENLEDCQQDQQDKIDSLHTIVISLINSLNKDKWCKKIKRKLRLDYQFNIDRKANQIVSYLEFGKPSLRKFFSNYTMTIGAAAIALGFFLASMRINFSPNATTSEDQLIRQINMFLLLFCGMFFSCTAYHFYYKLRWANLMFRPGYSNKMINIIGTVSPITFLIITFFVDRIIENALRLVAGG